LDIGHVSSSIRNEILSSHLSGLGRCAFSSAIPALLPIAFTVPVGVSFERLARKKVACSHSDSILIAGSVSKAFFDKTGAYTGYVKLNFELTSSSACRRNTDKARPRFRVRTERSFMGRWSVDVG
jgi:hypothetical protein